MEKRKSVSRILSAVGWAVIAVLCGLVIYMLICNFTGKTPRFFGYSYMKVVSGSMEPTIPTGSYILVKSADPATLAVGDVICFYSDAAEISGKPNTHRIIGISGDGEARSFVTKGDANPVQDDTAVPAQKVIGKYVRTLGLSGLGRLLSNQYFFLIVILIPAGLLFFFELRNVVRTARGKGDGKDDGEEKTTPDNPERHLTEEEMKIALAEYAAKNPDPAGEGEKPHEP